MYGTILLKSDRTVEIIECCGQVGGARATFWKGLEETRPCKGNCSCTFLHVQSKFTDRAKKFETFRAHKPSHIF